MAIPIKRSATQLIEKISNDPTLKDKFNPEQILALRETASDIIGDEPTPLQSDRLIYRIVVISLGLVLLIVTIGTIFLYHDVYTLSSKSAGAADIKPSDIKDALANYHTPEIFIALGSAAIGALAGLLSPVPIGKS